MGRCLTATVAAFALAFASAGCEPPHVKVPEKVPRVPDEAQDLNNIRKHGEAQKYGHSCKDDQGYPYDC
jgi:hypothetical protein